MSTRRYQRKAHRISSGAVCRHLKSAGRIAFFMISSGYQPAASQSCNTSRREALRDPQHVHEYVEYYHRQRNHQGLDTQLLQRPPPPVRSAADVQRREGLGEPLIFYYREAA